MHLLSFLDNVKKYHIIDGTVIESDTGEWVRISELKTHLTDLTPILAQLKQKVIGVLNGERNRNF